MPYPPTVARADGPADSASPPVDERFLHEIISTVGSSLELEQVLAAVVDLLSEASAVHACFVYLQDRDGARLVLRAASPPYGGLVGHVVLERPDGLAWWAIEQRRAAFIRDHALDDPRVKYVPELEEERFQSLVAIPLLGRRGDAMGAITLDTAAPREFTDSEVELFVSTASLVAGAIENARLYAEMRLRVAELEGLTELAGAVAATEELDTLGRLVVARSLALLSADSARLYLADGDAGVLRLRWAEPQGLEGVPATIGIDELVPELHRGEAASVAVSLVADGELLGALVATGTRQAELARAVANQAAVAVKKIQVLERLAERHLIRDFVDDLAARRLGPDAERRAARVGCDLGRPHLALAAEAVDDALEAGLAALDRNALVDRREGTLRALVPLDQGGAGPLLERVRGLVSEGRALLGVSTPCSGETGLADGFEQARHALLGATALHRAPALMSYDELGPYRYLLRIALDPAVNDATIDAVSGLAAYDRGHGSSLVATLDEFLARRGAIGATADALHVHPNTLRQRLQRIGMLSGIDLRRDDWLTLEIAVKVVHLRTALGLEASGG